MNDVIKTVPSLEKSGLLIDDASETAKPEIKKTRRSIPSCCDGTYSCFIDSTYGLLFNTTCCFFVDKYFTGKGVRREGKGQESAICLLLTLPFVMKAMSGRRYDKMDQMDKNL